MTKESTGYKTEVQDSKVTKVFHNGEHIGTVAHSFFIHHPSGDTLSKSHENHYHAVDALKNHHDKYTKGRVDESRDDWTTRYLSNNKIKIYNGGKLVEEIQWIESNSDKSATVNFNKERIGEINPKYRENGSFSVWEWSHDHSGAEGVSASKTEARNALVAHHREHRSKYKQRGKTPR